MTDLAKAVRQIHRQCIKGKDNPAEAAAGIDQLIGGVTRVEFNPNKTFRIFNHDFSVKVPHYGLRKNQQRRQDELVVILHHRATHENGASAIRLEPRNRTALSTKHHVQDYRNFQQQVLNKYGIITEG